MARTWSALVVAALLLGGGAVAYSAPREQPTLQPPQCARIVEERRRAACEEAAGGPSRTGQPPVPREDGRSLDQRWREAVEDSRRFDPGSLISTRAVALLVGLLWFALALRHQRRRRRRRRGVGGIIR